MKNLTNLKAFKAYDIRGKWGEELTPEIVYRIGFFLPQILKADKILVGRDARLSSGDMFEALTNGITDAGADVADAGLSTTPMVYWGTGKLGFDASVMITASHNPKDHNGLKVSGKDVKPIGYDNGLKEVESLIEKSEPVIPHLVKGKIEKIGLKSSYLSFLRQYTDDFSGLKITVDCSDGMASLFIKELLGDGIDYMNCSPDGNFPAHEPNPLEPENRKQIVDAVKSRKSDIGLIFDGDADRVMFIDEKGNFVSPDLIIALLGHHFFNGKEQVEGRKVVQDIRTSKAVGEYLQQFDVEMITWRVGRAYGATKLKEVNGIYGGELAGHYYFRDFYYSDSGLVAALLVLKIVNRFRDEGITFSEMISRISSYFNTGEVNFKIENKQVAMNAVKDWFLQNELPVKFYDFDGYRLEFADWWFNIRPSNTEPYLRFLAEARTKKLLDEKTKIIFNIITQFK
ncbi:MAG: phosphomannomutase/phosphoglucomutase [Chlorobi bacterium]|nr:phosphomannomutase/phosphoglucomutase [Chlorobiota bacterium]